MGPFTLSDGARKTLRKSLKCMLQVLTRPRPKSWLILLPPLHNWIMSSARHRRRWSSNMQTKIKQETTTTTTTASSNLRWHQPCSQPHGALRWDRHQTMLHQCQKLKTATGIRLQSLMPPQDFHRRLVETMPSRRPKKLLLLEEQIPATVMRVQTQT